MTGTNGQRNGKGSLLDRIEALGPELTRSERQIAAYLNAHVRELALENAASVARKAQVSPMTVGRFLRRLDYEGFDDVRREASGVDRSTAWRVGDRFAQFERERSVDARPAGAALDREIGALVSAYELASGKRWTSLVKRVASSGEVHVAGFQTVRGLAMDFAARLEYVRDGVHFVDGANGTYAELFARAGRAARCLVLVDIRRYARQAQLVAEAASEARVPIAILTDAHCHWARRYTADVFHIQTDVGLFWDSNSAITSLLNLLLNGVIGRLGPRVGERAKRMEALQARFQAFVDG